MEGRRLGQAAVREAVRARSNGGDQAQRLGFVKQPAPLGRRPAHLVGLALPAAVLAGLAAVPPARLATASPAGAATASPAGAPTPKKSLKVPNRPAHLASRLPRRAKSSHRASFPVASLNEAAIKSYLQADLSTAKAASRFLTTAARLTLRAVAQELPASPKPHAGRPTSARNSNSLAAQVHPQRSLKYLGTFLVTCYDLTGTTASGAQAGPSSVAVDPGVIALGTQIYVDGVGFRTADDTGGAIVGYHIDIWEPSYWQCADWGVQERAVYQVLPA